MNKYFGVEEASLFQFLRIPKALFNEKYKGLACEAKVLYGLLLDTNFLSIENKWIDEEGRIFIYFSRERAMEELNIGKEKVTKLFSQLKKYNLIEEIQQGQGKPNKIYVLRFILAETVEKTKRSENRTSKSSKIGVLKVRKSAPNNTNKNDIKQNDINNNNTNENLPQKEINSPNEIKSIENIDNVSIDDILFKENELLDNKNTLDISQEILTSLQEKINKTTKGKIHYDKLIELIQKKGIEKIELYLANFHKFQTSKHNAVGYFIKAVEKEYSLPVEQKTNYNTNQKPIQSTNFEQRVYDDDFFESLYDNFKT